MTVVTAPARGLGSSVDRSIVIRRRALTLTLLTASILIYVTPLLIGGDLRLLTWWSDCSMTAAAFIVTLKCVQVAKQLTDHERAAWIWFSLGMASWTIGNAVWATYELALNRAIPTASLVDPLQLALPACFAVGFWRYRSRSRAIGATLLEIGNLGIILASILLIYVMLFFSIIYQAEETGLVVVLDFFYPVLDASAFFLGLVTVSLYLRGRRRSIMSLLLLGLATSCLTEIIVSYDILWRDYSSTSPVNGMYMLPLAFVFWSAFEQGEFATRGVRSDLASEVEIRIHRARQWETLMPAVAVASVLAVAFRYFDKLDTSLIPYASGALIIFSVSLGMRDWWSYRVGSDVYEQALERERELRNSEKRLREQSAELEAANLELHNEMRTRMQIQEELRQSQKMEALGQLTGGVAHDFNNILTVVLGNLELLDQRLEPDSELRALTQDAVIASERGSALTRHLLAFSRKQALIPSFIEVGELLANLRDLLSRTLGATIRIEIETAPDLWPCIADKAQLENALLNLAINSRDAMPEGGSLVIRAGNVTRESARPGAEPGVDCREYVLISVRDDGVGMPSDVQAKVFEPFYTTKDIGAGSGLGLSMVYGFVKQSQGDVAIHSEPGAGTVVDLYLPRAVSSADSRSPAEARALAAGRGERILVVEDEAAVRKLVVTLLEDLGYEVFQAASGAEALAALDELDSIRLVLSDVVLAGGVSGPQILTEARRAQPGIQTLLMSGYAADSQLGDEGDAVEILHKPFKNADLARKIRSILESDP